MKTKLFTAGLLMIFSQLSRGDDQISLTLATEKLQAHPLRAWQEFMLAPTVTRVQHDRPDLMADTLMMRVYCLKEYKGTWSDTDCAEVVVDGEVDEEYWQVSSASGDVFDLPSIKVRFDPNLADVLCIGAKVLFRGCSAEEGCSNQYDFKLYVDQNDRYSVLSFCTAKNLPEIFSDNAFFAHRRVQTFHEFGSSLSSINLNLNPKK
ncbi:MAG: hypothetical protein AB7H97_07425 [Pseudobdellovibrionaceae bacterium]